MDKSYPSLLVPKCKIALTLYNSDFLIFRLRSRRRSLNEILTLRSPHTILTAVAIWNCNVRQLNFNKTNIISYIAVARESTEMSVCKTLTQLLVPSPTLAFILYHFSDKKEQKCCWILQTNINDLMSPITTLNAINFILIIMLLRINMITGMLE